MDCTFMNAGALQEKSSISTLSIGIPKPFIIVKISVLVI